MVARAIDLPNALVKGGAHALFGGIQRMAWENEQIGMLATGATIILGLLGKSIARGQMMDQITEAAFGSGTTIAGWVTAERTFKLAGIGAPAGALKSGHGMRVPRMAGNNGASAPGVSLAGVNPNTGESILGSRV